MTPPGVAGIILAGGRASRMGGGDKSLVSLGGRAMLARVIARLAPQVDALAISANGEPARFAAFDLPILTDTIGNYAGPLAGILAGMRWAKAALPEARFITSAAVDTPFFPTDLVNRLSRASGDRGPKIALAASSSGIHPTFGLWPIALAADLEAFLHDGHRKVLAFADLHPSANVAFADVVLPDGETIDPFFNVNTPGDAARAETITTLLARAG